MAAGSSSTPHNAGLSQSWISPAASAAARFTRLQTVASHLQLSRSPFFPKTSTEYNAHAADWAGVVAAKSRKGLEEKIKRLDSKRKEKKGDEEMGLGVGVTREEVKVNGCELAYAFQGAKTITEEEEMDEVGWHVAYSGVLGEKTNFWAGGEEALREGVVDEKRGMRAFWPDSSELKMEGENRARKTRQRRFPLPRVDLYSSGMIKHFVPPSANLTPAEKKALVDQIVFKKKVEDIAWYERQVVHFKHKLDRLPTLSKLWAENEKTENGRPYYTPPTSDCGDERVGGAENFAAGTGFAAEGYNAGDVFSSFSSADGKVFESSYGYNGVADHGHTGIVNSGMPYHGGETRGRAWGSDHVERFNDQPPWSETRFGFDEPRRPNQSYDAAGTYGQHAAGSIPGPYDGRGLPAGYAKGAEGPGSGKRPPPGGWLFDEDELRKTGWAGLFDEFDCLEKLGDADA